MSRLVQFITTTFGSRDRRGRPEPGDTNAWPTDDLDPWTSYVRVLEEARSRRGRLFSRS